MLRETPRNGVRDGDEVIVATSDGTPFARGFYHGSSMIAVRLLTFDPATPIDEAFLRQRIAAAVSLRRDVLKLGQKTNAWRLLHSEADGLSGLIADLYGDLLILQFFSKGFFARRQMLRRIFEELLPGVRVFFRADSTAGGRERMALSRDEDAELRDVGEVEIRENKVRFLVDPGGHKTGFFLDQRDNRERFATLVRGQKVLDTFAYTGGFSIAAATVGKASRVVAVDLDEDAVARGKRNSRLNRAAVEWVHADAMRYLRNQRHAAEPFEAIVVDPPKWAVTRARLADAERRYLDVNTYACRALGSGGLLLTCSCSGLVSEESFLNIVRTAAATAGRQLQIVHLGGAAADHPLSIHCPESRYLKAVLARVS